MNKLETNMYNSGGIYIILNLLDCKAYVGQTKNFNGRDHIEELERGIDNSNLQNDYDNSETGREFIYFIGGNFKNENLNKNDLDFYEQLYMTLMEDFGYILYNINISKHTRTIDRLEKMAQYYDLSFTAEEEYCRVKESLINNFKLRFNKTPEEIVDSNIEERKNIFEYYVRQRLNFKYEENGELIKFDRFYFNRKRICNILRNDERSIDTLADLDELFFSKVGNYIGEGIDQILNYEQDTIDKHGYCLWTFAANAVAIDTISNYCKARKELNKKIYVLFSYTPSSKHASANPNNHPFFRKKNVKQLSEEDKNFLHFQKLKYGHCLVPKDIDCTAANEKSINAFVVKKFFLLKECWNDKLYDTYQAVDKCGKTYDVRKKGGQRSTFYLKAIKDIDNLKYMFDIPEHRAFCFVGELESPYIIRLENKV